MEVKKPGISKMNLDVISTSLGASEVRRIVNGRTFTGNDGKDGVFRNIKGTTKVPFANPFSYKARVVGTARDDNANGLVFFIADPNGPDHIMLYKEDETVEKIAVEVEGVLDLNFDEDYPVEAIVIDGLLYFNDGLNPPRKLNIEKARNRYYGGTPRYKSMDNQVLSLIKKPPVHIIEPEYKTDNKSRTNKLRGRLFQFRYQWVYDDKEASAASPISKLIIPEGKNDYNGEVVGDENINNTILIKIKTGSEIVEGINIFYREGNSGYWNLETVISKKDLDLYDNSFYTYEFTNNNATQVPDQTALNRLYDAVPLKADSLGYIHTNNIILAGNTEGYDNIVTDTNYEVVTSIINDTPPINYNTSWIVQQERVTIGAGSSTAYDLVGMVIKGAKVEYNLPEAGDLIKINIDGTEVTHTVTSQQANDGEQFANGIVDTINSEFISLGYQAAHNNEIFALGDDDIMVYHVTLPSNENAQYALFPLSMRSYYIGAQLFNAKSSWKTGAQQEFSITYYDEFGRSSFAQKANSVYVPFPTEEGAITPAESGFRSQNIRYGIKWKINHKAPSWAKTYQWSRQISPDISYFRRYIIAGVEHGSDDGSLLDKDKSSIDITPLNRHQDQLHGLDLDYAFPNSSIDAYVFQKGDRIRFITKAKGNDSFVLDPGLNELLDKYIDLEIMGYVTEVEGEAAQNKLIVNNFDATPGEEYIGVNTLVEIYTPKKEQEDAIYYEMGEMFDIIPTIVNGNKVYMHSGGTQNQTNEQPAEGVFLNGDVYMVPTVFSKNLGASSSNPVLSLIESLSASNYYELEYYNIGRPNISNDKAKQEKQLVIRQSERYFEGTEVNGLSAFTGGNDLQLSSEFGKTIYKLTEVGFTLKAFQAKKVTSFFVGRTGLQLASGQDQDQLLADSSKDIGTKSPSSEFYGTIHKESVINVERNVYFVDANRASIVRISPNGMFDISNYGIKSEIYSIISKLKTNYNKYRIITNYNPITDEVGFGFYGITTRETVDNHGMFYFKAGGDAWSNVWYYKNQYNECPELFANMNQNYFSFLQGEIYKHETSDLYNMLYGNKLEMSVEMEFNENPSELKAYKIMEYVGKGNWHCGEIGDVNIQTDYSVSGKQQDSLLPLSMFRPIKGKQNVRFLKDANYKLSKSIQYNLINGDDLRGKIIKIKIRNQDDKEAYLDTVAVTYQSLPSI